MFELEFSCRLNIENENIELTNLPLYLSGENFELEELIPDALELANSHSLFNIIPMIRKFKNFFLSF
jgi:hypothetical protein